MKVFYETSFSDFQELFPDTILKIILYYHLILSSWHPYNAGIIILQMWDSSLREVKQLTQSHKVNKQDLNLDLCNSRAGAPKLLALKLELMVRIT